MCKAGYELEFEDTFEGNTLDESRWIAHYLSQWSSRQRSAARYRIGGGCLRLLIEADQQPQAAKAHGRIRYCPAHGSGAARARRHRKAFANGGAGDP